MAFYIERFIPKLVPTKDTLRVRRRDTPSFDTPVVTGLGEGARQKILIHQVFNRSVKSLGQVRGPLPSPCSLPPGSLETSLSEKVKFDLQFFFAKRRENKQCDNGIEGDEKKFERIRINLSHLGLVPGLCQGSRAVLLHW